MEIISLDAACNHFDLAKAPLEEPICSADKPHQGPSSNVLERESKEAAVQKHPFLIPSIHQQN